MKRIMKIGILSLWIYGGALTDAQIMDQVAALKRDMDQLHEGSETMSDEELCQGSQRYQRMNGEKYDLLNKLSDEAKKQIADAFMEELRLKLEAGNDLGVVPLLFIHDASGLNGIEDIIEHDETLAVKLTRAFLSPKFRSCFRGFIMTAFYHIGHVLCVCNLTHFMMTGQKMDVQGIDDIIMRANPNIIFIREMIEFAKEVENEVQND